MILTDDQIAADAAAAGFTGSALVTMVATDLAESGGDPAARGDLGLVTGVWGPSIGLAQIRSLNAQRGTGGVRDELANYDPLVNQAHAYAVSGGGRNFGPWTTFTKGTYRQYVDRAQHAALDVAAGRVQPIGGSFFGFHGLPVSSSSSAAPSSSSSGLSGGSGGLFDAVYRASIFGLLGLGAVGLLLLGGWRSVSPGTRQSAGNVATTAATVAVAA